MGLNCLHSQKGQSNARASWNKAKSLRAVSSWSLHLKSAVTCAEVSSLYRCYCNWVMCTMNPTYQNLPLINIYSSPAWIYLKDRNKSFLTCICAPRYNSIARPPSHLYLKLNRLQMMKAGFVVNAANKVQMDNQEKWLQLNCMASRCEWGQLSDIHMIYGCMTGGLGRT